MYYECNTSDQLLKYEEHQTTSGFNFELTSEQKSLQELAQKFAKEEIIPRAAHYDQTGHFPWDLVKQAHELGLRNGVVPAQYGGLGLSLFDSCLLGEALNYGCSGIGLAIGSSALPQAPVILFGNEGQKREYLGRMTGSVDSFFDNIGQHLPKLQYLSFQNYDTSDEVLNELSKLTHLRAIKLRTWDRNICEQDYLGQHCPKFVDAYHKMSRKIVPTEKLPKELAIKGADSHLYRIGISMQKMSPLKRKWYYNPIIVLILIFQQLIRSIAFIKHPTEQSLWFYASLGDVGYFMGVGLHTNMLIVVIMSSLLSSYLIFFRNYLKRVKPTDLRVFQVMAGVISPDTIALDSPEIIHKLLKVFKRFLSLPYSKVMSGVISPDTIGLDSPEIIQKLLKMFNRFLSLPYSKWQ
ncbi:unnamed protein product [Oppiella nova]|uniref:Acyl-CoA dehydrogenase/oxidase N-terminal domain-containing protein n=1 Tax=Oppiella nova TaxID=334625 RepID=A0A7R9M6Y7_9ACAR|nr:unnamed protein product [Oppiella nova]CAG2171636.1 unnamed protein product [Oppiella nova]